MWNNGSEDWYVNLKLKKKSKNSLGLIWLAILQVTGVFLTVNILQVTDLLLTVNILQITDLLLTANTLQVTGLL